MESAMNLRYGCFLSFFFVDGSYIDCVVSIPPWLGLDHSMTVWYCLFSICMPKYKMQKRNNRFQFRIWIERSPSTQSLLSTLIVQKCQRDSIQCRMISIARKQCENQQPKYAHSHVRLVHQCRKNDYTLPWLRHLFTMRCYALYCIEQSTAPTETKRNLIMKYKTLPYWN